MRTSALKYFTSSNFFSFPPRLLGQVILSAIIAGVTFIAAGGAATAIEFPEWDPDTFFAGEGDVIDLPGTTGNCGLNASFYTYTLGDSEDDLFKQATVVIFANPSLTSGNFTYLAPQAMREVSIYDGNVSIIDSGEDAQTVFGSACLSEGGEFHVFDDDWLDAGITEQELADAEFLGWGIRYLGDDGKRYECNGGIEGEVNSVLRLECFELFSIADAGSDQEVESGTDPVTLDGTGSRDSDGGQNLSYAWTPPTGIILSDSTAPSPTFSAPTLNPEDADVVLNFSLIVTDELGLISATDFVTVTVKAPANMAPTAHAGADQTVASGTDPVLLDGTGSSDPDAGQTLSYSWLQIEGPSVTLNDATTASPTFTAATLASGDASITYGFELVVTDNLGLASEADTVTVIVVAPPLLSIETPTEGLLSSAPTLVISGITEPGLEVLVQITNTSGQGLFSDRTSANADGIWAVQSRVLTDGHYTVTVTVVDAVDNVSSESTSFTINSTLPGLIVESPEDNLFTRNGAIEINGSTEEDAVVIIAVSNEDGNIIATPTVQQSPDGTFDALVDPELGEGAYTITISSTSSNGLSTIITRDVVVDQTLPVTTITQPGAGAVLGTNTPVIIGTTEPLADVDVFLDDLFLGTATADENGAWSFEIEAPLDDATYLVEAIATDLAGNVGEGDQVIFTVDVLAPNVVITSPTENSRFDTTPIVTGSAGPGQEIDLFLNGELVGSATANAEGEWTFVFEESLANGNYTIEATSASAAGTIGSSGMISFEIFTPADVVITSPIEGDIIVTSEISVEGTGEPGSEITLTFGEESFTTTVDADGNWSVFVDSLPEGALTIEATSNIGSSSDTITVFVETLGDLGLGSSGGCSCNNSGSAGPALPWFMVVFTALLLVALRRRSALEHKACE